MKRKRWLGGYVSAGIFVIEKKINGQKFHISTRCTQERAALEHLKRFEADPQRFKLLSDEAPEDEAVVLDEKMIVDFFEWHRSERDDGRQGVTREWALIVRGFLREWADDLHGKDLRSISAVTHLKPHLKGKKTKHHRTKAIKVLFRWLREERGLLKRNEDATLDLKTPTLKSAQASGNKKSVQWARVAEVAPHIQHPMTRDVLILLTATAWHISEVRRFAQSGSIRDRTEDDPPHVVAVLGTIHKSGERHFTALIHEQHAAAARRIRAAGHVVGNGHLRKHLRRACEKADEGKEKVEYFNVGMRHSVSTWLKKAGVDTKDIASFAGHTSDAMMKKHYIDNEVATFVLPATALRVVGQ